MSFDEYNIETQNNGVLGELAIPDFANKISDELVHQYSQKFKEEKIISIPNFVSEKVLREIQNDIENYKYWSYVTIPNNNVWEPAYNNYISYETINECQRNLEAKNFSYRFQSSSAHQYDTCTCIVCALKQTITGFPVSDFLCKIIGCQNIRRGEIFLSKYGKDDFLSLHTDTNKGDISVTFSLTYDDWHPCFGGILHFCDEEQNIYKSIVPKLGSLTIFDLNKKQGKKHFVSTVAVDKNRYTLTAWYFLID